MNETLWSIGEAAIALDRSIDTLRRWDKSGWLVPTMRMKDGTRLYDPAYIRQFHSLWTGGMSPREAGQEARRLCEQVAG